MASLEQQLADALADLCPTGDDDPDEVAAKLRSDGVKAGRGCRACPVAAWLLRRFPEFQVAVFPIAAHLMDPATLRELAYADLPMAVRMFIAAYDDYQAYQDLDCAA